MWAEFAPAKINLTLELTGKREGGYHTLESLIVFASTGDRILAEPAGATSLTITGSFAGDLQGPEENNLVMKALRAAEKIYQKPLNMSVTLEKNLPVASGIGGGSADAAAMLRLLRRVIGQQVTDYCFQKVALSLGADLPVCLESKSSFVSGIGEVLQPVSELPQYGLLLANPLKALSTKDVFAAWKGEFAKLAGAPGTMKASGFNEYIAQHTNMLEDAAISIMPEIAGLLSAIKATPNCILSRMSGSGATCFGLYETKGQAETAALALSKSYPSYWLSPAQLVT